MNVLILFVAEKTSYCLKLYPHNVLAQQYVNYHKIVCIGQNKRQRVPSQKVQDAAEGATVRGGQGGGRGGKARGGGRGKGKGTAELADEKNGMAATFHVNGKNLEGA